MKHVLWTRKMHLPLLSLSVMKVNSPVFDEGLEVEGEAHAERQQRWILLENFGKNLKVCFTVLVGKLSCGQLHLEVMEISSVKHDFTSKIKKN